jgi:hypothetical protein
MRMRSKKLTTGVAAATLALLPLTAAAADHVGAEIVVVHGVPGLEVDVLVDGAAAITGFEFGDVVKTTLPAGDYTFGVAATGTTDAILEIEASLGAGLSATIAAYLDTNGDPQLRAFVNENGASGIQPFHLANFGAVDILSGHDHRARTGHQRPDRPHRRARRHDRRRRRRRSCGQRHGRPRAR